MNELPQKLIYMFICCSLFIALSYKNLNMVSREVGSIIGTVIALIFDIAYNLFMKKKKS